MVVNWENIQFSRQDAFQKLPFNLVSEDVMDVPYDVRSGGFQNGSSCAESAIL